MKKILAVVLAAGVMSSTAACTGPYTDQHATCKVYSKDRATDSKGNTSMRVYTNCGTFKVEDSFVKGQFSSADTYGSLRSGHTYRLTYNGYRNGFLSMFPNIIHATEVKK